jgi:tripartite-type tricarboxylate transporter receptor subunit TctC
MMRFVQALVVVLASVTLASADPVEDFYLRKQISIYVGTEAGGGYDAYARMLARHMGKYVPGNPNFVVRNMPGSGGLTMANFIANIGPKDGTAIGTSQSTIAFETLLHLNSPEGRAAQFEAAKLNWLGSIGKSLFLVTAWHTAKVTSLTQLMTGELVLGTSGQRTDGAIISTALNRVLGTKIKLVPGYQSINGQVIALERGEIDAAALEYSTITSMRPDWLRDNKLRFIIQCGIKPSTLLPDVPFALDLVKSEEDRAALRLVFTKYEFGRPFFQAPGVPAERVAAMRTAFEKAVGDPEFVSEAERSGLSIDPMWGAELQRTVETLYQSSSATQLRARTILDSK